MAKKVVTSAGSQARGKSPDDRDDGFDVATGKLRLPMHLKLVLKQYEARCEMRRMDVFLPIKKALKECQEVETALIKVIFNPEKDRKEVKPYKDAAAVLLFKQNEGEQKPPLKNMMPNLENTKRPTRLSPLIDAMRSTFYNYLEILCAWGVHIDEEESTILSMLMGAGKGKYPIRIVCLYDCLISVPSLRKLAFSFTANINITEVYLDFNNFGDEGCKLLAIGLENNITLTLLSIRYCEISSLSGLAIGSILEKTPVHEIFLDGNNIGVDGLVLMLGPLVDFINFIKEAGDPRIEEEKKRKERMKALRKKMKKKGLTVKEYPPRGPYISKITLSDNDINHLEVVKNSNVLLAFKFLSIIIEESTDIKEIDLWGNNIGEIAGQMFIASLQNRKKAKLKTIGLRVGPCLSNESCARIFKLAPGPPMTKKEKQRKQNKFFD